MLRLDELLLLRVIPIEALLGQMPIMRRRRRTSSIVIWVIRRVGADGLAVPVDIVITHRWRGLLRPSKGSLGLLR